MSIIMAFLVIFSILVLVSIFGVSIAVRTKRSTLAPIIILALSLTGAALTYSYGFGLLKLFFYLPKQGKIADVLNDTSWIKDNRRVLYLNEHKLYSIGINGDDQKLLADNAVYYALSPDKKMIAIRYGTNPVSDEDRNTGNISVIDLNTGQAEQIEKNIDCGYPFWLPEGAKIFYDLDDSCRMRVYDVVSKIKRTIEEPKMICYDLAASKDGQSIFYRTLFDKKCYKVDVNTLDKVEIAPLVDARSRGIYDYVRESDVYKGVHGGNEIRGWKLNSPDGTMFAYNKEGSLWLNLGGSDKALVRYIGEYDSKFAHGVSPISWSDDAMYLACNFKGRIYVCDIVSGKTGYLAEGESARIVDDM